ncbi:hypothetical protein [Frigoriglobus tundricola]|uniref:Uncharacterized protein n=1 Tax=Frigoriglobus tundricola TaxID=2774151 RepID=A0A6M5YV45_9BACT|nr:hypothetical protein [Frigoriglobus tundricola]QJW97915.1 hypothetical protein FTUN_5495 [Frigoriglobus tundricola]
MTRLSRCACCDGALEPVQQLRFLVESATLDNPVHLARIRMLPAVNGKPLPVCKACQTRIESARKWATKPQAKPAASGLLGALGALSVGLLLSSFFNSRS